MSLHQWAKCLQWKAEGFALEAEDDTQSEGGAPLKNKSEPTLFPFYFIQVASLLVADTGWVFSLENPISHTQNYADNNEFSWAFLTQIDTTINYHNAPESNHN